MQWSGLGSKRWQAEPLLRKKSCCGRKGCLDVAIPRPFLTSCFLWVARTLPQEVVLNTGRWGMGWSLPNWTCRETKWKSLPTVYWRCLKNKPGGLKGRKIKPKVVFDHANNQDLSRCFVNIFKMYNSLRPKDRPKDAFYLQPLPKPSPDCWFSNKRIGYNKLDGTVVRLQEYWNPFISHKPLSSCYCSNQIISSWSRQTANYGANWTSKLGGCAQLQANLYWPARIHIRYAKWSYCHSANYQQMWVFDCT